MINTSEKALKLSYPAPVRGGDFRLTDNGSNMNISAASTGAAAATKIFDYNGETI